MGVSSRLMPVEGRSESTNLVFFTGTGRSAAAALAEMREKGVNVTPFS